MSALRIKRPWDNEDGNLFWKFNRHFSDEGQSVFWQALDRTIRYCVSKLDEEAKNNLFEEFQYEQASVYTSPVEQYTDGQYRQRYIPTAQDTTVRNDRYHYTRRNFNE